jgi:hypothetical protein
MKQHYLDLLKQVLVLKNTDVIEQKLGQDLLLALEKLILVAAE